MTTHRGQPLHYPIKFGFPQKGHRRGSSHPLNMSEFLPRQRIYMKTKKEFVEETQEQKNARWKKQAKTAKSFARCAGIDLKKVARERRMSELSKTPDY